MGELDETILRRELEHPHWRMVHFLPEVGADGAEESADFRLPAPPDVDDEFVERLESFWELWGDVECKVRLHDLGVLKVCCGAEIGREPP